MKKILMGIVLLALPGLMQLNAAEYYVTKQGNDANDGLSREKAFLTVQKGVDALEAGDTLTIGPGEYFENVRRDNPGSSRKDTLIRAEIPGTALLRGDRPAPEFKKADGYRFVYAAAFEELPQAVLERDTLSIMEKRTNIPDVEFEPGTFCYDAEQKKLFISSTDMQAPDRHFYTVGVTPKSGLYLEKPIRVVLEGLAATGFYRSAQKGLNWAKDYEWGILLNRPEKCTVRGCVTFLNAGGIATVNGPKNTVEDCLSFANYCQNHAPGGCIMMYGGSNLVDNVVRNCRVFKSSNWGIKYYGLIAGPCLLENNIAWAIGGARVGGDAADYQIKGEGAGEQGLAKGCIGLGRFFNVKNVQNCLYAGDNGYRWEMVTTPDNILLRSETNLNRDIEFADPDNMDFRLQADSRFRKAGPRGRDRGPCPFEKNIFYLSPEGNDENDGLSLRQPWRTLARAVKNLKPGDTIYLAEGTYAANIKLSAGREGKKPVSIRGRGFGIVAVSGQLDVAKSAAVEFERIQFACGVNLQDSRQISFNNCSFTGPGGGLRAENVQGLKVTHAGFANVPLELKKASDVILSGNIYANKDVPAVSLDSSGAILYSDYNSYQDPKQCWQATGAPLPFVELQKNHDRYSQVASPELVMEKGIPCLVNFNLFAGRGPLGTAQGIYNECEQSELRLAGPFVHSASETTANIEWWLSRSATCSLAWGDTPEITNVVQGIESGLYSSFSLAGLKPGRTYYFKITSAAAKSDDGILADSRRAQSAPISFATAAGDTPAVYHVATDGNDAKRGMSRAEAWRTLSHAAGKVKAGDTVLVAGGTYRESVMIRATGDEGKPVIFKSMPGEKVILNGDERSLAHAFTINKKNHCRFDGFYFVNYNGTIFNIRRSDHIHITRCFHDGRGGGYAGGIASAQDCADLMLKNCVIANGFGGMHTIGCPDLKLENNVFLRNLITAICPVNQPDQKMYFSKNIFTDGLPSKVGAPVMEVGKYESLTERDNCYYLRVPDSEKKMFMFYGGESYWRCARAYGWSTNLATPPVFTNLTRLNLQEYQALAGNTGSFVANPVFKCTLAMKNLDKDGKPLFMPDHVMGKKDLDFPDLFATDPKVVEKGIGLEPGAFKDFHFNRE
ncbi:MAG: DUF1565 domain-containing protein [Kiritimatiellia bacterium]